MHVDVLLLKFLTMQVEERYLDNYFEYNKKYQNDYKLEQFDEK